MSFKFESCPDVKIINRGSSLFLHHPIIRKAFGLSLGYDDLDIPSRSVACWFQRREVISELSEDVNICFLFISDPF